MGRDDSSPTRKGHSFVALRATKDVRHDAQQTEELKDGEPMAPSDNLIPPGKPTTRPGTGPGTMPGTGPGTGYAGRAPVMPPQPPRPTEVIRPGIEMPPSGSQAASGPLVATPPRRNETDLRTLIVGREIALSGEISSCDRLVVEGSVQANLTTR